MEEVVNALQGARLEDESDDEEQDDPAPDVAPAVAPAVANQARERWIDDVRQLRVDKEEDEFVVKIHKSFLESIKEVIMSEEVRSSKMKMAFCFVQYA
eukprot:g36917.t1